MENEKNDSPHPLDGETDKQVNIILVCAILICVCIIGGTFCMFL